MSAAHSIPVDRTRVGTDPWRCTMLDLSLPQVLAAQFCEALLADIEHPFEMRK